MLGRDLASAILQMECDSGNLKSLQSGAFH